MAGFKWANPGCCCYSTHLSCATCAIPRVNLTWAYRERQFSNPFGPWGRINTLVYNPTDIFGFPVWESGPTGYTDSTPGLGTLCRRIRATCSAGHLSWWYDDYNDSGCSSCSAYIFLYDYAGDMSRKQCPSQFGTHYYAFTELVATSCNPFDVTWWWQGLDLGGIPWTRQVRIYE